MSRTAINERLGMWMFYTLERTKHKGRFECVKLKSILLSLTTPGRSQDNESHTGIRRDTTNGGLMENTIEHPIWKVERSEFRHRLSTTDYRLVAFLDVLGFSEFVTFYSSAKRQVVFEFPSDPEIEAAVDGYFNDAVVSVKRYVKALVRVRRLIVSMQQQRGSNAHQKRNYDTNEVKENEE